MSVGSHATKTFLGDDAHLKKLGYDGHFNRSLSLWGTFALGFTYLSPLVGVYSLFAYGISLGGPPSVFWIVIVGVGQLLGRSGVRRSRLPVPDRRRDLPVGAAAVRPATRRGWPPGSTSGRSSSRSPRSPSTAPASWRACFGLEATQGADAASGCRFLVVALAVNLSGTKNARPGGKIGLAAELIGVIGVGLYLMIFDRKNDFSVIFDTVGAAGRRQLPATSSSAPR